MLNTGEKQGIPDDASDDAFLSIYCRLHIYLIYLYVSAEYIHLCLLPSNFRFTSLQFYIHTT